MSFPNTTSFSARVPLPHLVAWAADGATAEERHARRSTVRRAIDDVVKNGDSAKINQALLISIGGAP